MSSLRGNLALFGANLLGLQFKAIMWVLTGARGVWAGCAPKAVQRIYFANHASHGDAVLIWSTLPSDLRVRTRPVAGADYWLKTAMRRFIAAQVFNVVLVTRPGKTDAGQADEWRGDESRQDDGQSDVLAPVRSALDMGDSLIFFPEGTRNTGDAELLPLKSGLFRLAQAYPSVELVPVWIDNIRRVLPKGELMPVPLLCTVTFGVPLPATRGETKRDFLERARDAMLALKPVRH